MLWDTEDLQKKLNYTLETIPEMMYVYLKSTAKPKYRRQSVDKQICCILRTYFLAERISRVIGLMLW
jgi:hypothetical protein